LHSIVKLQVFFIYTGVKFLKRVMYVARLMGNLGSSVSKSSLLLRLLLLLIK